MKNIQNTKQMEILVLTKQKLHVTCRIIGTLEKWNKTRHKYTN